MSPSQTLRNNITLAISTLVLISAFSWGLWPIFWGLIQTWNNNEDYSHGFFIIPIIIYLVWQKKDHLKLPAPSFSWLGLFIVIAGLLFSVVGLISQFGTLANFAFIVTIWGTLLFLFGHQIFLKYGWEFFIFLFMTPIPSRIYAAITLPLQLIVTKISFIFLQLIGTPVYREGNILQLPNATLEVVNACSGLRSILTIILLSYIMACLNFPKTIPRIILILGAIPLAMFTNIIRVLVLTYFSQQGDLSFLDGPKHTILGIILFILCIVLLHYLSKALQWAISKKFSF